MKKISLIVIALCIVLPVKALEISCNFEEVYTDGSIQTGKFFSKNGNLRYEYNAHHLYTILYNQKKIYLIQNFNTTTYQHFKDQDNTIYFLSKISSDFPDFKDKYLFDNFTFLVEKKTSKDFINRIGVISKNLNLSIYFNSCSFEPISDDIFIHKPFVISHL